MSWKILPIWVCPTGKKAKKSKKGEAEVEVPAEPAATGQARGKKAAVGKVQPEGAVDLNALAEVCRKNPDFYLCPCLCLGSFSV